MRPTHHELEACPPLIDPTKTKPAVIAAFNPKTLASPSARSGMSPKQSRNPTPTGPGRENTRAKSCTEVVIPVESMSSANPAVKYTVVNQANADGTRRARAAERTVQIGNNDENLSNFSLSTPSADVKHETSLRKEVEKSHMPL